MPQHKTTVQAQDLTTPMAQARDNEYYAEEGRRMWTEGQAAATTPEYIAEWKGTMPPGLPPDDEYDYAAMFRDNKAPVKAEPGEDGEVPYASFLPEDYYIGSMKGKSTRPFRGKVGKGFNVNSGNMEYYSPFDRVFHEFTGNVETGIAGMFYDAGVALAFPVDLAVETAKSLLPGYEKPPEVSEADESFQVPPVSAFAQEYEDAVLEGRGDEFLSTPLDIARDKMFQRYDWERPRFKDDVQTYGMGEQFTSIMLTVGADFIIGNKVAGIKNVAFDASRMKKFSTALIDNIRVGAVGEYLFSFVDEEGGNLSTIAKAMGADNAFVDAMDTQGMDDPMKRVAINTLEGALLGSVFQIAKITKDVLLQKKVLERVAQLNKRFGDTLEQMGSSGGPDVPAPQRGSIGVEPEAVPLSKRSAVEAPAEAAPAKSTLVKVGDTFNEQAQKEWGGGPMPLTEENVPKVARALADEVESRFLRNPEDAGWYKKNLHEAMSHVGKVYPEVLTDPNQGALFRTVMALTSNGTAVEENAGLAFKAFDGWKKTGKVPRIGSGKEKHAINAGIDTLNELMDDIGADRLRVLLDAELTPKELKAAGYSIGGELADEPLKGSVIFGPKVGGGFLQNLGGNFAPVTFDRWWMRTFGRLTGRLRADPAKVGNQRTALRATLRASRSRIEKMGFDVDKMMTDDAALDTFSKKAYGEFAQGGFKKKTKLNNAARNLRMSVDTLVDAPSGGGERRYMRQVVEATQQVLRKKGINIENADMQALSWFFEKDLYARMGVKGARGAPDYAEAFRKITADRPVRRYESGGPEGATRGGAQAGGYGGADTIENILQERFGATLRRRFEGGGQGGASRVFRRTDSGNVRRTVEKTLDVPVEGIYKSEAKTRNAIKALGGDPPKSWAELTPENGGLLFERKLRETFEGSDIGKQLTPMSAVDLADHKLFVADSGKAGFAISPSGELVGVWKDKGAHKLMTLEALRLAVENGATHLSAFNTMLPRIYARMGFKEVSRTKFNREFAPKGWNPNMGEPDIVFMKYDPQAKSGYHEPTTNYFDDYDNAQAVAAK